MLDANCEADVATNGSTSNFLGDVCALLRLVQQLRQLRDIRRDSSRLRLMYAGRGSTHSKAVGTLWGAESASAHVGYPLLLLTLVSSLWLRRQLKHRRLLSLS